MCPFQVGDVAHAKMFTDTSGRPRGVGILEFGTKELAKEAVRSDFVGFTF